jgi:hypothetical protein
MFPYDGKNVPFRAPPLTVKKETNTDGETVPLKILRFLPPRSDLRACHVTKS